MPATAALVIIAPVTDARNPTLTATTEMTLPCLCLCSVTNMSTPAAPCTNSEEKRAQRKTQYHISVRFLSTVPWAQRLRTCCTDRLIMEWSPPSAFIFPGGRPPPSPRVPGGGGGCEVPGAAAGTRLLQAAAAAGEGCGAPGWTRALPPTGLRGGQLGASPRQPPPRRGDIEDSGRGRGGDRALSSRGPRARTRAEAGAAAPQGRHGAAGAKHAEEPRSGQEARGDGQSAGAAPDGAQLIPAENQQTRGAEEAAAAAAAAPAASLPTLRPPTLEEPPPPPAAAGWPL